MHQGQGHHIASHVLSLARRQAGLRASRLWKLLYLSHRPVLARVGLPLQGNLLAQGGCWQPVIMFPLRARSGRRDNGQEATLGSCLPASALFPCAAVHQSPLGTWAPREKHWEGSGLGQSTPWSTPSHHACPVRNLVPPPSQGQPQDQLTP